MRTVVLLLAGVLLQAPPAVLVGLWEGDVTSRGGIGATLEFKADGTCTEAATVIVDFMYRVENNLLILEAAPGMPPAPPAPPCAIDIRESRFTTRCGKGPEVRRDRMAPRLLTDEPIVGTWRYPHPTGVTAYERYTSDGRAFLRIPLQSVTGKCQLSGNELTMIGAGRPGTKIIVDQVGDVLRLTDRAGQVTAYHRDPGGPWYERARIQRR